MEYGNLYAAYWDKGRHGPAEAWGLTWSLSNQITQNPSLSALAASLSPVAAELQYG